MPNKKINQLDSRVGVSLTDLSLVGDPASGTSFKLTLNDVSTVMGVPGKFNQPTGTAAQYIRGDGQLATFPSSAGGGSSVNYYLNGSINASVGGYKQMDNSAIVGGGTDFTLVGNGLIAQFLTNVGNPNRIQIPGGAWNFEMFFQVSSSGGNQKFYIELHKYDGATFTLIASSSTVPEEITGGTSIDLYLTSLALPTTTLLATDRLAIRVYIVDNAVGRTVTLHTENNTLCEIITTFAGGVASLNGLTANTQYLATGTSGTDFNISSLVDTHTFNLPTASATNRGALSTADWSAFNNKIGGSGVSGQVAYFTGANTQAGSNNLFWDNTNGRLGIGTATPSVRLQVLGADAGIYLQRSGGEQAFILIGNTTFTSGAQIRGLAFTSGLAFTNQTAATEWARFHATGNFSIGSTTDTTQRLQVTGQAIISSTTTHQLEIANPSGGRLLITAQATANSFSLLDSQGYGFAHNNSSTNINARQSLINIWTQAADTTTLGLGGQDINPTVARTRTFIQPVSSASVAFAPVSGTAIDYLFRTTGNSNFQPTSGTATYTQVQFTPVINQTGGANGITRGLYINPTLTAAADWRSIETSNNSGWAFYGAGTAQSQFGGAVTIAGGLTLSSGSLSLPVAIHSIFASAYRIWNRASNRWTFEALNANIGFEFKHIMTSGNAFNIVNSTDVSQFLVSGAGNTILGSTTDTTERLQVNGTMKITGNTIISSTGSAGVLIGSGGSIRYTSNSGVNTSSVYFSGSTLTQDVIVGYVGGSATSNIYSYIQTSGYIGTRGGLRLGAANGTDVVSALTSSWLNIAASTTDKTQINLAAGTAPTTPQNGDIWFDGTDLKMRIGGLTKTFTIV